MAPKTVKPSFNIRIRRFIVEPGQKPQKPRKKTCEEIGLYADMSQFYPLKAMFERLLGKPTYLRIKESAHLPYWKEATLRLLDAMRLSIRSTVRVADPQWFAEVDEVFDRGKKVIKDRDTIADLLAGLATTLIELSFAQIGAVPAHRHPIKTIPLDARYWTFDAYRSVQYVQTKEQRDAVEVEQQRLAENRSKIAKREAS